MHGSKEQRNSLIYVIFKSSSCFLYLTLSPILKEPLLLRHQRTTSPRTSWRMIPTSIPRMKRAMAIPATAPFDSLLVMLVALLQVFVWLVCEEQYLWHCVALHSLVEQLQSWEGGMLVLFMHRSRLTLGPRPSTKNVGVTVTPGEIWIWNGSWFEPTVVPPVMRSTACWAVTFVNGSICARLLRLEIWNVTSKWVPFSRIICNSNESVCVWRGGGWAMNNGT